MCVRHLVCIGPRHKMDLGSSSRGFVPFRQYVPEGKSFFDLDIPRRHIAENVRYHFSDVSLVPEFYSQQASAYNLDPDAKHQEVSWLVSMEVSLVNDLYDDTKRYEQPIADVSLPRLVKTFNRHMEAVAPPGLYYPSACIDWIDTRASQQNVYGGVSVESLYESLALDYWGTALPPESLTLPAVFHTMPGINRYPFPTKLEGDLDDDNEPPEIFDRPLEEDVSMAETTEGADETIEDEFVEAQEEQIEYGPTHTFIRARFHVQPNTSISFNNDKILLALGFDPSQFGTRGAKNRFHLHNFDSYRVFVVEALNAPEPLVRGPKSNYVYFSSASAKMYLPHFPLATNRERESNPVFLADDFHTGFKRMGRASNFKLGLSFDSNDNKFKFQFPANNLVQPVLKVPVNVASQLGFGNKERIFRETESNPIESTMDVSDNERRARALAIDTGMVVIGFENSMSVQTVGMVNEFVAALHFQYAGHLSSQSVCDAGIVLSKFGTRHRFSLQRFSDSGVLVPLKWPVGSYVQGVLSGRV